MCRGGGLVRTQQRHATSSSAAAGVANTTNTDTTTRGFQRLSKSANFSTQIAFGNPLLAIVLARLMILGASFAGLLAVAL